MKRITNITLQHKQCTITMSDGETISRESLPYSLDVLRQRVSDDMQYDPEKHMGIYKAQMFNGFYLKECPSLIDVVNGECFPIICGENDVREARIVAKALIQFEQEDQKEVPVSPQPERDGCTYIVESYRGNQAEHDNAICTLMNLCEEDSVSSVQDIKHMCDLALQVLPSFGNYSFFLVQDNEGKHLMDEHAFVQHLQSFNIQTSRFLNPHTQVEIANFHGINATPLSVEDACSLITSGSLDDTCLDDGPVSTRTINLAAVLMASSMYHLDELDYLKSLKPTTNLLSTVKELQ